MFEWVVWPFLFCPLVWAVCPPTPVRHSNHNDLSHWNKAWHLVRQKSPSWLSCLPWSFTHPQNLFLPYFIHSLIFANLTTHTVQIIKKITVIFPILFPPRLPLAAAGYIQPPTSIYMHFYKSISADTPFFVYSSSPLPCPRELITWFRISLSSVRKKKTNWTFYWENLTWSNWCRIGLLWK